MEAEEERAAEAQREKEAGNDAYRKQYLETAVDHYTRGAALDPRDISFLTNRAAAYLLMSKYKECVSDCEEAVERGRELRADNRLLARALSRKGSALLKLAACAADYAPAIRALQQSLAEHYSEDTRDKLDQAESARKEIEERERLDQEAADHHRQKGNELFQRKNYQEATAHYTEAIEKNPNDPRVFSNRAQCHIYLGNLPKGLEDAEKCIELDPTFLKGYVRKANVQFLMDYYESALATYIEGLKCDPNNLVVIDGLRRCAACINRSNGGNVGPDDLEDILGNVSSDNDLRNKLQKLMEEAAALKKEASDERLRRIESERMARTSEDLHLNQVQQRREAEECLSKIEQEFQQLKVRQDEVSEEFQKATEHNENLQHQLTETIRALESMRGNATSASPSSWGSVLDENRIPSYFICPISQDVMNDPHIAADGFTYEGDFIRSWFSTGSDTSPMTNLPLEHDELIPNIALRSAIQEWLQQQNVAL